MREKKRAVILTAVIGILFAGSLTAYVLWRRLADGNGGPCIAQLYQDGELIEEIDLSRVEETYQKTIQSPHGGCNVIEVRHNAIGIIEADCPDKLCQKQGFSSQPNQPIVCLPNRFMIELKREEAEFDAVT